jgi:hypothetical protein
MDTLAVIPQGAAWQVKLALSLIAADFALAIVRVLTGPLAGPSMLIALLLMTGLYALWLLGLYRRINWVRWLTIAGALIGILSLPWMWSLIRNQGNVLLYVFKYVLFDAGAILLCTPQAHAWYTRPAA